VFKNAGIRVSIFVDPVIPMIEGAAATGTDRIELYTESYAKKYIADKHAAVQPFIAAANFASSLQLGINAGHDLDLNNLRYLKQSIPQMDEVSIGHALISDAIYMGFENAIKAYRIALQ
jgi:pyridoxine 5-phosphate synthase